MPTYYFDCHHVSCPEECLGHDVANHDEAHRMAIEFAGEILLHEAHALVEGHDLTVTVSDESHLVLFSVYARSVASPAMSARR